ncbi:unnamed protein product, partial [Ixodes hexagonus]
SPSYIRTHLPSVLRRLEPRALLNYLGLMALIRMAPFLSETLTNLRALFAKSVIGRSVVDPADSSLLCIYSVEKLLPGCFNKAAAALLRSSGSDLAMREWVTKLDSVFSAQAKTVAWVNQLSSLLLRYRIKRGVSRFGPGGHACAPSSTRVGTGIPLMFYLEVSKLYQEQRLRAIMRGSAFVRSQSYQSDLSTQVQYHPAWQAVYVPTALVNTSVPVTGTVSAFHLPRFAVRYYRALVEMLFDNSYPDEPQFSLSDEARGKLASSLACLKHDLERSPAGPSPSWRPRTESLPHAVLSQVLALKFAYSAFLEQLHIRRIWSLDFYFEGLPKLSAVQLFFVYYALDNCESTGVAYDGGLFAELPASYRVNVPLRYLEEFMAAFSCRSYSFPSCSVFKS